MREVRTALFLILGFMPFILSTLRILLTDDLSSFWDAKQYLQGFQAIQSSGNIFGGMSYFGKITEITLSSLYLFISYFITIETTRGILLLNNTIFWIIYIPALLVFSKRLLVGIVPHYRSKWIGELTWLNALLMTPLGVAFQVGRQAICFAIIFYIVTLVSRKKIFLFNFLVFITTILTHVYSLVTSFVIASLIKSRTSFGLILLFAAVLITYFGLNIFNETIPILYVQTEISPFSNLYLNFSLLVILIFFIPTQRSDISLKNLSITLFFITIIALYAFQPLFIIRRILFGFDHVILFFSTVIFLTKRYSWYPSRFVSKLYLLLPLTVSLKILEAYLLI
ncbi:hypothetical protein N9E40_04425 [Amylibacter sp.]|nr:hypothetical protein [Amylibacter sp.]